VRSVERSIVWAVITLTMLFGLLLVIRPTFQVPCLPGADNHFGHAHGLFLKDNTQLHHGGVSVNRDTVLFEFIESDLPTRTRYVPAGISGIEKFPSGVVVVPKRVSGRLTFAPTTGPPPSFAVT